MRIHFIRNATMVLEFSGKHFLINPMFAPKNSYKTSLEKIWPKFDLPMSAKDIIKNIDAVLLSNLHSENFDKYAENLIPKYTKIYVQDIFDKNALEKSGFDNIEVLSAEGTEVDGVKIHKTPCLYGTKQYIEPLLLGNGMRWESMGLVFVSEDEPMIYYTGDTRMFAGVETVLNKFKPEVTIINASETILSGEPVTMGVEDIKILKKSSANSKIVAVNLDNLPEAKLTRTDLRESEICNDIYIPADGEIMVFEKP